uniref:TlpA family protein disulfide reductase n=1 Tax=Prevotella sp. TaxID=59823 RepID=UPI003FEEFE23
MLKGSPFLFSTYMKIKIISLAFGAMLMLFSCTDKSKNAMQQTSVEQQNTAQPTEILDDFSLPDVQRDFKTLSEEIAKHDMTVIDFWASWCGPCRNEMPTMVKLRQSYNEKQLGIIGVSLDTDYNKWTAAFDEMQMNWPQFSELKGWDSYIVQKLGINSIPYTIIVDKDRNILAKGLRGKELERYIESKIKQP